MLVKVAANDLDEPTVGRDELAVAPFELQQLRFLVFGQLSGALIALRQRGPCAAGIVDERLSSSAPKTRKPSAAWLAWV